jgi:hypothetical protein
VKAEGAEKGSIMAEDEKDCGAGSIVKAAASRRTPR